MAGYCRICHTQNKGNIDTLIACNNCGSLVCDAHHTWWQDSKNAFCTECFPLTLVTSLTHSAAGLNSLKGTNLAAEEFRHLVEETLRERNLSLDELLLLLHMIISAIKWRSES
jgi:hypothetical protein